MKLSRTDKRWECREWNDLAGVLRPTSLLVLVGEPVLLAEGRLAKVLHPAVLAQEGGGQSERQAQLEGEAVDARRKQHRLAA